jgi:pyruvate dehydrogenase E2 component (dihydrolipoamide acetyltransferase)
MAENITMPKLGFDMAEGKLVRWVKKQGEEVKKGEVLAEIETDKATVELEALATGVLAATLAAEGEFYKVGALMGVIAAPGEKVDTAALPKSGEAAAPAPPAESKAEAKPTPAPAPAQAPAPKSNGQPPAAAADGGFVRISPIARRMADEMGIDPRQVQGTGPEGRITKKDVEAFARSAPATAGAPAAAAAPAAREDSRVPLTRLRSAIARRMVESKTSVPHFYVTSEIDMGPVMEMRRQLNALVGEKEKLSVNDFVVKAAALALRQFPNVNASFGGDAIVRHGRVNIGNAVATDNGLLTVVVHDADTKSLSQISAEVRAMAARAREGKVKPEDVDGSTLTLSNLGMYDVESFVAIINPPDSAILAVGSAREVPVVKDGLLAAGWRMKATLSADHRVTDGAEAAQFLQALKKHLEEPLRLVL